MGVRTTEKRRPAARATKSEMAARRAHLTECAARWKAEDDARYLAQNGRTRAEADAELKAILDARRAAVS